MFQGNDTTTIDPIYEYNPEFYYWAKVLEWILIRYVSSYVCKSYSIKEQQNGNTKHSYWRK